MIYVYTYEKNRAWEIETDNTEIEGRHSDMFVEKENWLLHRWIDQWVHNKMDGIYAEFGSDKTPHFLCHFPF